MLSFCRGAAVLRLWNNLSPNRRGEVLGLGIITFGLIVFLSLISFHATDFERSDGRFDNWIGLPGAWIALLGIRALGWIVFLIPLLLLHWGVRRFRLQKFSSSLLPISGTLILIFSLCTLLAIWFFPDPERMIQGGGIVGSYAAQRMMVFGPVGSYLILLAMAAIAREAEESPEKVTGAPQTTFVKRLDEARAARQTDLAYQGDLEGK